MFLTFSRFIEIVSWYKYVERFPTFASNVGHRSTYLYQLNFYKSGKCEVYFSLGNGVIQGVVESHSISDDPSLAELRPRKLGCGEGNMWVNSWLCSRSAVGRHQRCSDENERNLSYSDVYNLALNCNRCDGLSLNPLLNCWEARAIKKGWSVKCSERHLGHFQSTKASLDFCFFFWYHKGPACKEKNVFWPSWYLVWSSAA